MREVKRLRGIHRQLAGATAGYKHDVEVLHKSAIVLLVACWEAFVEDLATNAFEEMLKVAKDHSTFPNEVLTLASAPLKSAADGREVWKLAGPGWRQVIADHKSATFKQFVGKLNTPKPKQIDGLFSALLGISSISQRWHWKGMAAEDACKKLEQLVELRGSIAHRVSASAPVYKYHVTDYMGFFYRLSVISSNRVLAFVNARTGTTPWPRYNYKKTN